MAGIAEWIGGARPRTLPAAVAPVVVGTGLAAYAGSALLGRALLALVVAVALQVGVNYANDYSDGVRGTDAARVGPVRLVGQGLATPRSVRSAALLAFAVAAVAGLALVILTGQWWLLAVGVASIAAAWLYTGGPRPYGYAGLGEVFVLVFFGVVPVVGTAYVQTLEISSSQLVAGLGVGAIACAILVANNLRDIPGDTVAGKRTLAVRVGDPRTRVLYVVLLSVGVLVPLPLAAMTSAIVALAALVGLLGIRPALDIVRGARGLALVPVLQQTGVLLLAYGITLGALLTLA